MARKSCALLLLLGLVMTCSAQAAESSKRSKPKADVMSGFRGPCERDPDGSKFAAKVCYLRADFDVNNLPFSPQYRRPTCDGSGTVSAEQREILAKAYRLAPNYARARFCRLTQVFLTKGATYGSWGLWEAPDRRPGTGVFVAITDSVLGEVKSLGAYESDILAKLLGIAAPTDQKVMPLFMAPEDPAHATLGLLAHELGHVLLALANADGSDGRHPRRAVRGPPRSACFDTAFLAQSWDTKRFRQRQNMLRWVAFGVQGTNRQKNVRFDLNSLSGKAEAANDAIARVYRSGEFVSVHAAINPVEDFVETFRYKVLADVREPLTIRLPAKSTDSGLRSFLAGRVLRKKVDCLRELGLLAFRQR